MRMDGKKVKSAAAWTFMAGVSVALIAATSRTSVPKTSSSAARTGVSAARAGAASASRLSGVPSLGENASLNGKRVFPPDNPWNTPIDKEPVDPSSSMLISAIGRYKNLHPDFGANYDGGPFGIPYIVVSGSKTPKVPVKFEYADESDPGPYPIPFGAPIEGGPDAEGDRHVLVLDRDNWKLYELYNAWPKGTYWEAGSGAIFDLNSNKLRPAGWTSADAAGLPIFPGLVRYDEAVIQKNIPHALRFTVAGTRKGYVYPARHHAGHDDPLRPPMGMRVRLKANYDISGFPPTAQVILRCLKKYGMILADNGSDWFVSGAPDPRWDDDEINTLKRVKGSDFEVVKMGPIRR
jgi:hypothetical protein